MQGAEVNAEGLPKSRLQQYLDSDPTLEGTTGMFQISPTQWDAVCHALDGNGRIRIEDFERVYLTTVGGLSESEAGIETAVAKLVGGADKSQDSAGIQQSPLVTGPQRSPCSPSQDYSTPHSTPEAKARARSALTAFTPIAKKVFGARNFAISPKLALCWLLVCSRLLYNVHI